MHTIYYMKSPDGLMYIGQTSLNLKRRISNGRGYRDNPRFCNDVAKYGFNNFEVGVLAETESATKANELERYYISQYDTTNELHGYNNEPGGISGYQVLDRVKNHQSNTMKGRRHTEEFKLQVSKKLKSRILSEEHRRKIGDGNKKQVCMVDDFGNVVKIYSSNQEAAQDSNVSIAGISMCCHGKKKSIKGLKFCFADEISYTA